MSSNKGTPFLVMVNTVLTHHLHFALSVTRIVKKKKKKKKKDVQEKP